MTNLIHTEINCSTGEITERPLTAEEVADNERVNSEILAREAAFTAAQEEIATLKASAKVKLIAGQPLTEEEAALLIV
jgi:hypothetical protein